SKRDWSSDVCSSDLGENPIVDITVDAFTGEQDTDKININQATKEEIETLSGIGPAKAQAIIDYREEHGLFQSIEDLQEVSGIGRSEERRVGRERGKR